MLRKDKEEAEAIKNAKALEEEKAMYSVRDGSRGSSSRLPSAGGAELRLLPAGPTFPAPEEGIPGEALERQEDQPPQVGAAAGILHPGHSRCWDTA